MFHITPTPTSWMIWAAIWVAVIFIFLVLLSADAYLANRGKHGSLVLEIFALLVLISGFFLGGSSYYYNYTHSADYIESKKTYKQNYDTKNQHRELTVKNYAGKVIYHYDGSFKFTRSGHGLNLVNVNSGKKVAVYIGDNDSVTVVDK